MTSLSLHYQAATPADVPAIVALVNGAYRGDSSRVGWTTEADLLGGQRTDADEVSSLIDAPDSLVLLCRGGGQLLGSTHLALRGDHAYLGMFTVRPQCQGQGIGKAFLAAAEGVVQARFGTNRVVMTVIERRAELLAFYERRGYRRTGRFAPFPDDVRYGVPKVPDLRLAVLEKALG